jgi:hypothetical protein
MRSTVNREVVGSSPTPGAAAPSEALATMSAMAVPILIFVACLVIGIFVCARLLPGLAEGPVGGLSFFVVCGLASAGLAVFGLHIYIIVEALDREGVGGHLAREVVADGLSEMLWQGGLLFGFAGAVFLLAPGDEPPERETADIA